MADRIIWGGRYAVYDEVASGGMASVFLAARLRPDPEIPAVVALKKLSAQFAKQPEFVAMFLDEAHLAARVRHPNVVTTYEFLRTDEGLGIIMDLVVGASLVQLLRASDVEDARPPVAVCAAILVAALEGLHAAHEATDDAGRPLNLVHRDVSPHNILVGGDGVPRVIDFGVAKAAGRLQTTDVGVIKGKFAYMAPEQIQGAAVDRKTDVYAAGIVLWETLTGRKLFSASSNEELLLLRSSGKAEVPRPSSIDKAIPRALDGIALRAMAPDPGGRYATARAMAEALRAEVALADASTIAAWLRSRVGAKLDELEAKRRTIEATLGNTQTSAKSPKAAASASGGQDRSNAVPLVDIPDAPAAAVAPQSDPGQGVSSTADRVSAAPSRPRRFGEDLVLDEAPGGRPDEGADLHLELEPIRPSESRSARAVPSVPVVARTPQRRAPHASSAPPYRLVLLLLLLVLALGLGGGALLRGPAVLRERVIAAAADYGLVITVDRAEVSRAGVTLHGVNGALRSCPGVRVKTAEAHVDLGRSGDVQLVSITGYEIDVSGPAADLASQLAAWRKASYAPLALRATGGHLLWSGGTIPGVVVEALDVAASLSGTAGTPFTLDTASLLINLPRGHAGPWLAHLESSATETRARVGFDPANAEAPPSATFIDRQIEGASWSLDIPRRSTFKIGVPAELFGLSTDLSVDVALHATAGPSGSPLSGEGHVGLYGLPVAAGHGRTVPIDVVVSGKVAGDPATPLALTGGKLTLGKAASNVSGALALKSDGLRVEIDRPSAHGETVAALVFDSREWTGAADTAARRGTSGPPSSKP